MDGLARALSGVHTTCLNVITGWGVSHKPVFICELTYWSALVLGRFTLIHVNVSLNISKA